MTGLQNRLGDELFAAPTILPDVSNLIDLLELRALNLKSTGWQIRKQPLILLLSWKGY